MAQTVIGNSTSQGGLKVNGALQVGSVTVIDADGNIDAPVTTTDLTTTGNTTIAK